MPKLQSILCLDEFEAHARRHLPAALFGYVSSGCEDNQSLGANRSSFQDYAFKTRVLVDVSARDQSVCLFGDVYASPFGIAPMGLAAMTAHRGDVVLAQAAQQARIPAIMSGWSLVALEEVAAQAPATWFQAYLSRREDHMLALIQRVKAAGFKTLVVTVDTPAPANRESYVRVGYSSPLRLTPRLAWQGLRHPGWLWGTFVRTLRHSGMPHFENWHAGRGTAVFSRTLDADVAQRGHLTWEHIARIRRMWSGPLVLKGLLHPADAQQAHAHGVDGIIVSNHGGRQLDGAAAPLHVLPAMVEGFQRGPVMIDGGFRRGSDVLKALALGASCAFVGRPFNYAASVGSLAGVAHAIHLLRQEVSRDMAMLGLARLDQLTPEHLLRRS